MKLKVTIIALFLVGMFACTQRTCPTYTNDDVKKVEPTEQKV